ncbi:MAG: hypothetical protein IJ787_04260 [Bacilli bacterium]|nr:hypothetical protein [Bacilli bacterium]
MIGRKRKAAILKVAEILRKVFILNGEYFANEEGAMEATRAAFEADFSKEEIEFFHSELRFDVDEAIDEVEKLIKELCAYPENAEHSAIVYKA